MTLRIFQLTRSVKQTATICVDVLDGEFAERKKYLLAEYATDGDYDHLWRDVLADDVDDSNATVVDFDAGIEAKKSLRYVQPFAGFQPVLQYALKAQGIEAKEWVRFSSSFDNSEQAMKIELLRNRYNHLTDPGRCDESEGIRSHQDMACILADMKHWCDFFKVDFSEVQRLSEDLYQSESAKYRLEAFNKKQL